jgi:hypothetical protein
MDDMSLKAAGRMGDLQSSSMTLFDLQSKGGSSNPAFQYKYPKGSSSFEALDIANQGLRMPTEVVINGQTRYTEYGLSDVLKEYTLDQIECDDTLDENLRRDWCLARLKIDGKVILEDADRKSTWDSARRAVGETNPTSIKTKLPYTETVISKKGKVRGHWTDKEVEAYQDQMSSGLTGPKIGMSTMTPGQ